MAPILKAISSVDVGVLTYNKYRRLIYKIRRPQYLNLPWMTYPFGNAGSFKISVGAIRKINKYVLTNFSMTTLTYLYALIKVDDEC
jgi:hypothetical protein